MYEYLAKESAGSSVKALLHDSPVSEADLRDTLRKLEAAGLARRFRAVWMAIPIA